MISGLILAAGSSSRMGRPKQLLDVGGRPMLQWVIDAAHGAGLDEIVVVLGHEAATVGAALLLPAEGRTVVNPDHAAGQSTSLRAGLDALDRSSEAAVILLGDQPSVGAAHITRALEAFRVGRSPVLRSVWRGTPGHPVVVARSEWDEFRGLTGDIGARQLLSDRSRVMVLEMEAPAPPDVDTAEDYERLKRS